MEYLSSTSAQTAPRPEHRAENVRNDTGTAVKSWFRPIPIRAMVERLKLMADLELPCTVCLGDTDEEHCCRSVIRTITLADGRLSLDGQGFSLHIREDHIQSVQLVQRRRSENSETAIEIFSVSGNLLARFVGTRERERAAIWQDIMDSFAVASC